VRALTGRGDAYFKLGKYELALDDLERSLKCEPRSARARLLRARVLIQVGRPEEAKAELHRIRQLAPDDAFRKKVDETLREIPPVGR
jgi:tetratricopeptide (TPR) repeat protein